MHNEIKINDSLYYLGGDDRRLALFENRYPIPDGISYNSFLYLDERNCLLDTVDMSVSELYFDNLSYLLGERKLDYLIVSHLEPDHSYAIKRLLSLHPELTIVTSALGQKFLLNFFPKIEAKFLLVKDGDTLSIGKHRFHFLSAPLVHWPEVIFSYEETDKILYSADAFGTFGANNGNLFCQMENYKEEHLAESRRYYANIVGKFGNEVNKALQKASSLDIEMIAPLHGPLLKGNLEVLLNAYGKWANYEPEEKDGVLIVYASIYGNTASAAEILANKLSQKGIKNLAIYDVSKTDLSYLIAESFRVHTIILCSSTIDGECYSGIGDYLRALKAHNCQKRSIGIIESGSWAPKAKSGISSILSDMKDMKMLVSSLSFLSSLKEEQLPSIESLASEIAEDIFSNKDESPSPFNELSSGFYAIFSKGNDGVDDIDLSSSFFALEKDGRKFALALPHSSKNLADLIETGIVNVSCLSIDTDFSLLRKCKENKDFIKESPSLFTRSKNGLLRFSSNSNAYYSLKVENSMDYGEGLLFILSLAESKTLNDKRSLTHEYCLSLLGEDGTKGLR